MKPRPPGARSSSPSRTVISQAAQVSATIAAVAVRGTRFRTPSTARTALDEFDLLDTVVAVARRRRDLHVLPDLATDQGAAKRRIVADAPDASVRFGLADELIADRLVVF